MKRVILMVFLFLMVFSFSASAFVVNAHAEEHFRDSYIQLENFPSKEAQAIVDEKNPRVSFEEQENGDFSRFAVNNEGWVALLYYDLFSSLYGAKTRTIGVYAPDGSFCFCVKYSWGKVDPYMEWRDDVLMICLEIDHVAFSVNTNGKITDAYCILKNEHNNEIMDGVASAYAEDAFVAIVNGKEYKATSSNFFSEYRKLICEDNGQTTVIYQADLTMFNVLWPTIVLLIGVPSSIFLIILPWLKKRSKTGDGSMP